MNAVFKSREVTTSQKGVTLTELMIVVAIIGVVVTFSIPSLSSVIDNSRLKSSMQNLAAVYQDARLRATQNDTAYEVLVSAAGAAPATVCIDLDGDGVCGVGDPITTFPLQVTISNVGVPVQLNLNQLHFTPVSTENSSMFSQQGIFAQGVAWNSHGIPCQRASATAACLASGWVQYVQFQRSNGTIIYGAVSVTPTGHVKTWIYSTGNGNGQWL